MTEPTEQDSVDQRLCEATARMERQEHALQALLIWKDEQIRVAAQVAAQAATERLELKALLLTVEARQRDVYDLLVGQLITDPTLEQRVTALERVIGDER